MLQTGLVGGGIAMLRIGLLLLACLGSFAQAADIAGSADHPLLPRYQDAQITAYSNEAFRDWHFLKAPARVYGGLEKNREATLAAEGAFTRILYRVPVGRSPLEVLRNYEQALGERGFAAVFRCEREACGGRNFNHAVTREMALREQQKEQQYLLARLSRAEGDVLAAVYVVQNAAGGGQDRGHSLVQLEVLEQKPMESRMVVIEAPAMQRELSERGRVAIYGVLFDHDSERLRADSQPQLQQIARLLQEQPRLRALVVGHTDASGRPEYNRELSQRRAQSVVAALVGEHGIAAQRLIAEGVGMAAPVASNATEQGRALNRRVELVERID